jgi:hypothetical protein
VIELTPAIKPFDARVASASNCLVLAGLYAMLAFSWTYSKEEGERLLGIGLTALQHARLCGILDWEPAVECRGALVKGSVAVPIICTALSRDYDGAGGCATSIGIFIRGANGEFLDGVRRKILQKATDPVIRIVATVDREIVVKSGASTG